MTHAPPRAETAPIRVFLVDDHEVVLDGLRLLLGAQPDIEVVGEATTVETARGRIPALLPDVAVIDLRLPDGDGAALCRDLRRRCASVRWIVLTAEADDAALVDVAAAGAQAFLVKTVRGAELDATIRRVAAGHNMIEREQVDRALERAACSSGPDAVLDGLSARELEVLELLGEGLSNRQIADRLLLADKTVKNYVSNVLTKLGLQRRSEAAVLIVRLEQRRQGRRRPISPA